MADNRLGAPSHPCKRGGSPSERRGSAQLRQSMSSIAMKPGELSDALRRTATLRSDECYLMRTRILRRKCNDARNISDGSFKSDGCWYAVGGCQPHADRAMRCRIGRRRLCVDIGGMTDCRSQVSQKRLLTFTPSNSAVLSLRFNRISGWCKVSHDDIGLENQAYDNERRDNPCAHRGTPGKDPRHLHAP